MSGELGVDVEGFNYNNNFLSSQNTVSSLGTQFSIAPDSSHRNTNLSSHYLNLIFNGPFVDEKLASYVMRAKLNGSFFNSTSQNTFDNVYTKATESRYLNPEITNFYGKLSLFPNRKFPMELYHSESNEHNIQYEGNNRNDVELVDPASGVVRHYLQDRSSDGYSIFYNAHSNIKMQGTIKKDETQNIRIYDFGADKDIYLSPIVENGTAFTSDRYDVTIVNDLPDATLEIIIDDLNIYTISANLSQIIVLDSGTHIIEVASIPNIYNKIGRSRLVVNQNLTLRYSFVEPATPNDLKQTLNVASLNLTYDNQDKLKSIAVYEYSDQKEGFQKLTTYLNNFNNAAIYTLGANSDVSSQTNFTQNQTDVDTSSHQVAKAFVQSLTLNHLMNNGVLMNAMYAYNYNNSSNRIDSLTGFDTLTSKNIFVKTDQILSSNTHIPSLKFSIPNKRFYNHNIDLGINSNFLTDNTGYKKKQYSLNLKNNLSHRIGMVKFEPRNDIKYTKSIQEIVYHLTTPTGSSDTTLSSTSNEIESRFFLKSYITNNKTVGDLTAGLEYGYRNKFSIKGDDIKNRYVFDFNIIKKFNKTLKLSFLTIQERELFTVFTSDSTTDILNLEKSRIDKKASYKFDVTLTPWEDLLLSVGYMTISQQSTDDLHIDSLIEKNSTINKLTFSLDFKVPYIKLPVKMFYTKDTRDIDPVKIILPGGEYIDTRTVQRSNLNISLTTKISYQFRKISLVFTHKYKKEEETVNDSYSIHELNGKITRRFGIF